jgi:Fe-S oxidoreductase
VHGFLGRFERVAARNAEMLRAIAQTGTPLIGLDPSMTLTYRHEYPAALGQDAAPPVMLVQEWLAGHVDSLPCRESKAEYRLLPHCTERTLAPGSLRTWQDGFARCGLTLHILPSGCCGMAGTYGHETEHRATSELIYSQSWAKHVRAYGPSGKLLATGYSCRSQAALIDRAKLHHPVQVLLRVARGAGGPSA